MDEPGEGDEHPRGDHQVDRRRYVEAPAVGVRRLQAVDQVIDDVGDRTYAEQSEPCPQRRRQGCDRTSYPRDRATQRAGGREGSGDNPSLRCWRCERAVRGELSLHIPDPRSVGFHVETSLAPVPS